MHQEYFVYILASKMNGTLYIGCASDLIMSIRINLHKDSRVNIMLLGWFTLKNMKTEFQPFIEKSS